MSASSNTMKGALPPSSSDSFLTVGAHCAIRMRPTSVEPVKLRWRTTSLAHSTLPTAMLLAPSAVSTLSTPAGMPARTASSAAASADSGVSSAGLMTTGQPAASAGATLRVIIAIGKFHGVMAAHTPIGCLQHHQAAVVVEVRQGFAVDALGFFGKPLDEARAVGDFALGLGQRLALLGGHDARQVVLRWPSAAGTTSSGWRGAPWRSWRARPARRRWPRRWRLRRPAAPRLATSASFWPVAGSMHVEARGARDPLAVDQGVGLEQAGVFEQRKGGGFHVHQGSPEEGAAAKEYRWRGNVVLTAFKHSAEAGAAPRDARSLKLIIKGCTQSSIDVRSAAPDGRRHDNPKK